MEKHSQMSDVIMQVIQLSKKVDGSTVKYSYYELGYYEISATTPDKIWRTLPEVDKMACLSHHKQRHNLSDMQSSD